MTHSPARSTAIRLCVLSVAVLSWLLPTGCATNPVSGEQDFVLIDENQETALGAQYAPDVSKEYGGRYPDEAVQAYATEIGRKVAAVSHRPNAQYTFTVLNSEVVNAFALPGGPVFITTGLLGRMSNEAQLAAVLGHEVGHVAARHGVRQMSQAMGAQAIIKVIGGATGASEATAAQLEDVSGGIFGLVQKGYGRSHEFESDKLGVTYATKAGYNPIGVVQLLEILQGLSQTEPSSVEEFFMTHPLTSKRITQAKQEIDQQFPGAMNDPKLALNAERFMARTARVRAEILQKIEQQKTSGKASGLKSR